MPVPVPMPVEDNYLAVFIIHAIAAAAGAAATVESVATGSRAISDQGRIERFASFPYEYSGDSRS